MLAIHGWCLGLLLGFPPPAVPPAQPPDVVEDVWEAVHSGTAQIGYVHTWVLRIDAKLLRTTAEMRLTFRRQGATLSVRQEQGTEETPDGAVIRVFAKQYQGAGIQLDLNGTLEDGKMHVIIDKGRIERRLRWSDEVVGLAKRMHYFEDRKPKSGDRFTLQVYEPTYNTVVTLRATVGEPEEVSVLGKQRKLLRVDLKPDVLDVPGQKVQLPASVVWLDERYVPVRRQIEMEGLGPIVLTRATRAQATAGGGPVGAPDINTQTMIFLNRAIPKPHSTRSIVYRVTVKDDPGPGTALVQDEHQEIRNLKGNTFDLQVHPVEAGAKIPKPGGREKVEADAEYLASNDYIPSDDPRIRGQALRAVGKETDPWRKAQNIERWVKDAMKVDNLAPMASARVTAVELRGDCRHYALLTAALSRAQGIPSRTAIGLLYVIDRRTLKPALGFHMWTEVWIDGHWLGLDATLGQGRIGAGHVKITHHSWHDTKSLTPFLPVTRVLGKLAIEVVQVEGE
jgi:Transglutaminase-like superfamily